MGAVETLKESGSRGWVCGFSGHALGFNLDQRPDRRRHSPARRRGDGAGQSYREDPFTGCRKPPIRFHPGDLHLFYDDVYSLSDRADRVGAAAEAAALASDPRITNSDGGSFDAATGRKVLANSRGFVGGYRTSYAGVAAAPLAMDANGQMQRDAWWSAARRLADLESPESIARKPRGAPFAARGSPRSHPARAIVFAPETARTLIGSVFEAAAATRSGVTRHFWLEGWRANRNITLTIIDDNTMLLPTGAGGFAVRPSTARTAIAAHAVVECGILRSYLLNTYSARKLGMKSTHNASRGLAGTPASVAATVLEPAR